MKLKQGVKVQGIRPELLLAIIIAKDVYESHNSPITITSLLDGKHSATSLHYTGCAFDLRTRHLSEELKPIIAKEIKEKLTIDYDVVLEATHIHIEYQPRY